METIACCACFYALLKQVDRCCLPGTGKSIAKRTNMTLSVAIEEYCKFRINRGTWTEETRLEFKTVFSAALVILGGKPVTEYSYQDAEHLLCTLQKLPPNRNKVKNYKNKSITQILRMKRAKTLSVASVNKVTGIISSVFRWAEKRRIVTCNPFSDLRVTNEVRQDKQWLAFSDEEIGRIFSPRSFLKKQKYHIGTGYH